MAKAKKTGSNPLSSKKKGAKVQDATKVDGVENDVAGASESSEPDPFDKGAGGSPAPAVVSEPDPFQKKEKKGKADVKKAPAAEALSGASIGSTDLKNLKTFTVEGEYLSADGNNKKVVRYSEKFVLSSSLVESEARSLVKKLLIASRLRDKFANFKRVRTHVITNVQDTVKADLDSYGLKHAMVDKMGMGELAMFAAHNGLDIIPHKFTSVEEARFRVTDAFKSGKRINHIPKDAVPGKVLPGQVNKDNKPVAPDNGLME